MPKTTINDSKGLFQETGSGTLISNAVTLSGATQAAGALYSGNTTVRAAATAEALDSGLVQLVDSTDDAHKVKMPLAAGGGQLMVIVNVDSAQDVVVRNNADDATLLTLGEGKTAICVSTASGDNWTGSQLD